MKAAVLSDKGSVKSEKDLILRNAFFLRERFHFRGRRSRLNVTSHLPYFASAHASYFSLVHWPDIAYGVDCSCSSEFCCRAHSSFHQVTVH